MSKAKLASLVLLLEMDDGKVYHAPLSERQESAIRSVILALPEPLKVIENPLEGIEIEHKEKNDG